MQSVINLAKTVKQFSHYKDLVSKVILIHRYLGININFSLAVCSLTITAKPVSGLQAAYELTPRQVGLNKLSKKVNK